MEEANIKVRLCQAISKIVRIERQLGRTRNNLKRGRPVWGAKEVRRFAGREWQIQNLETASRRALGNLYRLVAEAEKVGGVFKQ